MLFTDHEIAATRTEMDVAHAIWPTDSELGDWEADLQSEAGLTRLREWPKLCDHALDFHYAPSTMGGDFAGVARAIGQPNVSCFRRLDDWQREHLTA